MSEKTPEQTNPPDSQNDAPKPKRARAKRPATSPITLAGGVPGKPSAPAIPLYEQFADEDRNAATTAREVAAEKAAAPLPPAADNVQEPTTDAPPQAAPTAGQPQPSMATEPVVAVQSTSAMRTTSTDVTAGEVQTAFEAECDALRRRIVALDVEYAMAWYPVADAIAGLKQRYEGRLQNLAAAIGGAIGRSERFVYLLLRIAAHPAELRVKVREVGLGEDQGRLVQLAGLASEARDAALEAFGTGGPTAFDAVAKGTTRNPALAALLAQVADPKQALGGIAAKDPKGTLPATITQQFPELAGKTDGDILKMATAPGASQSDGSAEKKPKKGGDKPNPERDWQKGFDLAVAAEKTVNLRKAEFTLLLVHVVDADGNEIKGATAKVQVLDRTL